MAQHIYASAIKPPLIACVLKSGGEYGPEHVAWLKQQIDDVAPGAEFVCLSDVQVPCSRIPLTMGYSGWWSKLELCRPSVSDRDILYFDLDTVITGDIKSLISIGDTTIMRDVYRQGDALQSSVMYLTFKDRCTAWEMWAQHGADYWKSKFARLGDQGFFEVALPYCGRWQDVLPGRILSYKVDVRRARDPGNTQEPVPGGACVVVFHGKPRPWHVSRPWIPELQMEFAL